MNTVHTAAELLEVQDDPCISIILPGWTADLASSSSRDTEPDSRDRLNGFLDEVKQALAQLYPPAARAPIISRLVELPSQLRNLSDYKGLGIYLSPEIREIVQFDFPVEQKVAIGDSFAPRELLVHMQRCCRYLVLEFSDRRARLFEGRLDQMTEIASYDFPDRHRSYYEYPDVFRSSSLFSYPASGKGQSFVDELRSRPHFHRVDELLGNWGGSDSPLILMGLDKSIASFQGVTSYGEQVIASLPGNYAYSTAAQMGRLAWEKMACHFVAEKRGLLAECQEKGRLGFAEVGVEAVRSAIAEGRGDKLVVEIGFLYPPRLANDPFVLLPSAGWSPLLSTSGRDVVHALIKSMLSRGGEVTVVENGLLKQFNRIVLLEPY